MRLLSPAETVFSAPRLLFIELFKHQSRLVAATRLPEEKLPEALNELLESVQRIEAASAVAALGTDDGTLRFQLGAAMSHERWLDCRGRFAHRRAR